MIRIVAPEPAQGRTTFLDVDFTDGVAEVEELHPIRAQALEQHGYTLTETIGAVPSTEEPGGTAIVDLNDLTVPELRDLIGDRAEIPAKAKKAALVDIAAGLPAEPIPGDIDNGDGTFTAPAVDASPVEITATVGIPSPLSQAAAGSDREAYIPLGAGESRNKEIISQLAASGVPPIDEAVAGVEAFNGPPTSGED